MNIDQRTERQEVDSKALRGSIVSTHLHCCDVPTDLHHAATSGDAVEGWT